MKCNPCIGRDRDRTGFGLTPAALSLSLCVLFTLFLCAVPSLRAQPVPQDAYGPEELANQARLALSQNLADYLFLGTLNADLQYSVHRAWTLQAGAKYNNWTWRHRMDTQFESRQQCYYVGARWWPWYTYSGWWLGGRLQYREYNRGGLFSQETEEGDAIYDLSGRQVVSDKWSDGKLPRGIYVKQGKKVGISH